MIRIETVGDLPSLRQVRILSDFIEAEGLEMSLPDSPQFLLVIKCRHGILGCRLVDHEVADKLNIAAAIFSAARLEDILAGTPVSLTSAAIAKGIELTMTGEEIIALFSE